MPVMPAVWQNCDCHCDTPGGHGMSNALESNVKHGVAGKITMSESLINDQYNGDSCRDWNSRRRFAADSHFSG